MILLSNNYCDFFMLLFYFLHILSMCSVLKKKKKERPISVLIVISNCQRLTMRPGLPGNSLTSMVMTWLWN